MMLLLDQARIKNKSLGGIATKHINNFKDREKQCFRLSQSFLELKFYIGLQVPRF